MSGSSSKSRLRESQPSATSDQGFVLQDDSGGVYVKVNRQPDIGSGTHVRVTGRVEERSKLRIIDGAPDSVTKLDGTRQFTPPDVQTGAVKSNVGLLVYVSAQVSKPFTDDSPYGYELFIDDGSGSVKVFFHRSAGFEPATLKALSVGQSIQVTGFAGRFESEYEVDPRQPSDVVLH